MNKLSKAQLKLRDEHITKLDTARDNLRTAITDYNDQLGNLFIAVRDATREYNEAVGAANSFLEELASDAQNYYDEKSEKWQEGERGEQYQSWIETFQEEIDEVDTDAASEIEEPDLDEAIEKLEGLVESPTEL